MNLFQEQSRTSSTVPKDIKLRPYQRDAREAILTELDRDDLNSTMLVLPTGCGKTISFADIAKARSTVGRVLVLVHREELADQAFEKIEGVTGLRCEIEMGDRWADMQRFTRAQVVIASVQTMNAGQGGEGRKTRFDPTQFSTIIIDECHHAPAKSYRQVLEYFIAGNPQIKILGVTATPDRKDEQAMGQVFESCAYDYEVVDAVNDGWLVPIKQRCVYVEELDFADIRTTAGDLNGAQLDEVMTYEKNLQEVAAATIHELGERQGIVFATSVAHAERLAEIFNRHNVDMADFVTGTTPKVRRKEMFYDFGQKRFQVLVNVGVATEGVDVPGIDVVVIARPTKSRSLYAQMVGRGTRPFPPGMVDQFPSKEQAAQRRQAIADSPKPYLEVLDFVGNAGRHKLITPADILGGRYDQDVIDKAAELARTSNEKDGKSVDVMSKLEEAKAVVKKEREEEQKRKKIKARRVKYSAKEIDPFDALDIEPQRERGWDKGRQLTDKQRKLLERQGIDPDKLTYNEARIAIGKLFERWDKNLCSLKQAKILKRYGFRGDLSKDQAKIAIDEIAKNGWRNLPPDAHASLTKIFDNGKI